MENDEKTNTFLFTKKRNMEDILCLAKEPSCGAGPQHVRQRQIEPEGSKVAEANEATQKCWEKYDTRICTVFSPPLTADWEVLGMVEELDTTWCCI